LWIFEQGTEATEKKLCFLCFLLFKPVCRICVNLRDLRAKASFLFAPPLRSKSSGTLGFVRILPRMARMARMKAMQNAKCKMKSFYP
jgi:hypothetical protein